MSRQFLKIRSGINLGSLSSDPSDPQNGDFYFNTTTNVIRQYTNSNWHNVVGDDLTQTLTNKTLDFLRVNNVTDSSTTGSNTTITTNTGGTLILTNASLVSVGGIATPGGTNVGQLVIENATGNTITFLNQYSGVSSVNRITTGTGSSITVSNGASLLLFYDIHSSYWAVVSGTGSGSGSGSGGKNYLTTYTASTSSGTPNTGNGNFEFGTTTGWSLAHSAVTSLFPTSVASAGSAFSSSSGGTAASANLSFTTISSGQLAGNYSGSLASTTVFVAGDMLISNAFFIDKEDQAKVLTTKFYYNLNAGSNDTNFSGTSLNTFSVFIYDVTNAAWIQPAGVYGMTQNSGTGICTATFQTTSNSTQYQLALIQTNTSVAGSYTLYVDDFSVGPQTSPIGVPATDWTQYTPTFVGQGTVSTQTVFWRRVGDSMEIHGTYTAGTPTGVTASLSLPNNSVIASSSKLSSTQIVGKYNTNGENTLYFSGGAVIAIPGASVVNFGQESSTSNGYTAATGSTLSGAGAIFSFFASFPIAGWSSNVQMSNDTDTRVVEMSVNTLSTTTVTSGTAFKWTTVTNDTHAAYNASTGAYIIPVSGQYLIGAGTSTANNSSSGSVVIQKNGSPINGSNNASTISTIVANTATQAGSTIRIVSCNAGDSITIVPTATLTLASTLSALDIMRISGPSVVAATESVNAKYTATSGATIGTSLGTVTFANKIFDSHAAFNGTTYTVPVSGKYLVTAKLQLAAVTLATNQGFTLQIQQNGTVQDSTQTIGTGGTTDPVTTVHITSILNCVAGDTIIAQADSSISTALSTNGYQNNIAFRESG